MMYSRPLRLAVPAAVCVLAACSSTPLPPMNPPDPVTPPAASAEPAPAAPQYVAPRFSSAANPRAYRQDAATHIYSLHQPKIFKGRLPPLLYAVGVLQVEVDQRGEVRKLDWMRAPRHAPEVIAEIERMVRASAPFPVPARMGKVVYTDTWLWHKDGRFQLDTLTEGQD